MSEIAPYGTEATPPPDIEKGEKVVVTNLSYKVVDGKWGPQYELVGELENGFKAKAWVKKYDKPSTATKLYRLCAIIDKEYGYFSKTIDEALNRLIFYNHLYFECTGHREYNGKQYPKFSVYDEKLPEVPPDQKKLADPSKADRIMAEIAKAKEDYDLNRVKALVDEEIRKGKGLLDEEAAAYLLSRTLGVDLETSGVQVA